MYLGGHITGMRVGRVDADIGPEGLTAAVLEGTVVDTEKLKTQGPKRWTGGDLSSNVSSPRVRKVRERFRTMCK